MNNELDLEIELEIDDSEDEESEFLDPVMQPFNPADIDIVVEPKSLDALIKRMQHDEIDMNTDFQRHAELWDNRKMSRLIESILIRFPLPAFYFDASDENNWLIVDGLQRLSTIRKFVIEKKLRLSGLEFLTELNGKNFDKLHRQYQRRIEECSITVYMIKPGTPGDVKYSVFRRINTGGLTLNNQEIRNALAKPRDRNVLEELASLECSKVMLGDLSKRMKDQELVLRFWAFYRFDYLDPKNKKEIASFLDKAMEELRNGDSDYLELFKTSYLTAISRCHSLLGVCGFEKDTSSDNRKKSKNTALYEVWMVALAQISEEQFGILESKKDIFQEKSQRLLSDSLFFNAITYSTQKKDHVEIRYDRVRKLIEDVLND
ncbi:DUF262 domain-containing protein [Thalassolituus oleivorans]|uniref:GmrSD restriction endonucleases N-terminal domain-containing protein n=1 Tax=Thalassolituus oleivorans MIL-1 TaxID=1298593 RepID=M5DWC7_9GAMM|nr:DUF262 domain-containing protein [Thalassolituus oleivorans]CCU73885.1 hypothetical protein TOL_3500 [Thalassolituus oleivorans MIL-1]